MASSVLQFGLILHGLFSSALSVPLASAVSKEIDPPHPPRHWATYQAKLLAAAYIFPHVGNDPLLAWETVENLANKDEHYRRLRQWVDRQMEAEIVLGYSEGIKSITRQDKLSRAKDYFERLLDEENIPGLPRRILNWYYGRWVEFSARLKTGKNRVSHTMNWFTFASGSKFSGKIDGGGKTGDSDREFSGSPSE